AGTFVNECRDRYFWMTTKRSFLIGGNFRFDIIGNDGINSLDERYAASCGFTYSVNIPGDLIFRASFLACHVSSNSDSEFSLRFRFVRIDQFSRETYYPFSMTCSITKQWYPREIVCEENYMEISVRRNVPVIAQEGMDTEDWQAALPAVNIGTFDGTHLAWVAHRILTPLVLHIEKFQDKGIAMGVEGKLLDLATIRRRNYELKVNETFIEISVPYGAEGGYLKSHVINNQYNRIYAIDLYLEHQWADDLWEATQHRSFKPSGLTLPEAINQGIVLTEVQHPNGTKSFVLKVPFTHPLIPQKYIGNGVREFTLNINYTLTIIPENAPYFHPATIVCQIKDVILPVIKGSCTEKSLVFEVTRGNMDHLWAMYIEKHQLTSELAAQRGYILTNQTKFILEVPLFSIGCIYEEISLRGLFVRVELTLIDIGTLATLLSAVQRCQFPTKQLLVCMPNGVMTVVAVTMEPIPVVEPSKTTLLDKTCKPKEFDSTRALFTFSVNTCGTRSKIVENYLIYENEVVYTRALFPANAPVITRDSEYSCLVSGDSYKTRFHPVSASALTKSPHHLKRLEVQAQSVANHALWQQYIGNGVREFTLNINYTLNIIPENAPYFHPATIVCQIKDVSKYWGWEVSLSTD
ncbi:UNVERIFIED_CONTAM: hypothetical protein FKN15_077388, partial [Acipenser sinensis]